MAVGANKRAVREVFRESRLVSRAVLTLCDNDITRFTNGAVTWRYIIKPDGLIEELRGYRQRIQPSTDFTQPMLDRINAQAQNDLEDAPVNWMADNDALRAAITTAMDSLAARVPTLGGGKIAVSSFNAQNRVVYDNTSPADDTAIIAILNTLRSAVI